MIELPIQVPVDVLSRQVPRAVDAAARDLALTFQMRGSLKSYRGSTHWHLKRDRGRGTLEITWWPRRRRLWIEIQRGRAADWIHEIMPRLKIRVRQRLSEAADHAALSNRQNKQP